MSAMTDRRRALARAAWRTLTTREAYANPWIRVREDVAEMPDGRTTLYGVIECKPAIGVLPLLDARTVVLVGQYRYVARNFYWEIPTGGMLAGESEETSCGPAPVKDDSGMWQPAQPTDGSRKRRAPSATSAVSARAVASGSRRPSSR